MQEFGRKSLIGLQDDNWVRSARLQSSAPAAPEFRSFRLVSKQSFSKLVRRCRSGNSAAASSREVDSKPGLIDWSASRSLRSRRISLRRGSHDQSLPKSPLEGGWGELRSVRMDSSASESVNDSSADESLVDDSLLPWLSPVESIVSQRPMHRIASDMLQLPRGVSLGVLASRRWGCDRGVDGLLGSPVGGGGAPPPPGERRSGTMRQNLLPNLSRVCGTRW